MAPFESLTATKASFPRYERVDQERPAASPAFFVERGVVNAIRMVSRVKAKAERGLGCQEVV